MAEIRISEGETAEKATKRFEMLVRRQGIISDVKNRSFFRSPSEKRRLKSKRAQKRARKLLRIARRFEPPDNKSAGWELLQQDIEHGWPIDLKAKPLKMPERNPRNTRFIEEPVPAEEPSDYAAFIFEFTNQNGETGIVLVQNEPDKKGEKPSRFGFPGGSVKPGETPHDGGVREVNEETGFIVSQTGYESFHFMEKPGNHTKHFFAGKIIGGSPYKGEEISVLECRTIESLTELVEMGYLRSSHAKACRAFLEWRKSR